MDFDAGRVQANVRGATTEDLLDRITVFRSGMEDEALAIIESELGERGISADDIDAHARARGQEILRWPDGTARPCSFCDRPAVIEEWGWHRWLGIVPLFPRRLAVCTEHRSGEDAGPTILPGAS
jgi:hypothetical protein